MNRRIPLMILLSGIGGALAGCADAPSILRAGNPGVPVRYTLLPATGYSYDQNGNPIPSGDQSPGAPGGLYNPYR